MHDAQGPVSSDLSSLKSCSMHIERQSQPISELTVGHDIIAVVLSQGQHDARFGAEGLAVEVEEQLDHRGQPQNEQHPETGINLWGVICTAGREIKRLECRCRKRAPQHAVSGIDAGSALLLHVSGTACDAAGRSGFWVRAVGRNQCIILCGPVSTLWCVELAAAGERGKAKQSAEPTEQGRGQVSAASRSTRRSASGQPHGRGSGWWSAALTVQDAGVEGLQGFCDDLQAVRDRA